MSAAQYHDLDDPDADFVDPMLGVRVGSRYVLKGVLGEGGMGIVYDAVHEQLERHVAVKVIRKESLTPRMVERFRREAVTVSGLGHPNIIDIHDVGVLEDGRPFMVMPKLSGRDLGEDLEAGRTFSVRQVVRLFKGPARALDLVHKRGIVHRDLKPENLFIEVLENGETVVKIVDFGLAAPQSPEARRLTKAGMITGTPEYMSPESARGDVADGRSDIYSLAVVAFELLTGQLPFYEGTPFDIVVQKTQEDAPTLRSRGFDASDALEEVFAIALARDPDNRYPTATEFITALRRTSGELEAAATGPEFEVPVLRTEVGESSEDPTPEGGSESPASSLESAPRTSGRPTDDEQPAVSPSWADEPPPVPTRRVLPAALLGLLVLSALGALIWWMSATPGEPVAQAPLTPGPMADSDLVEAPPATEPDDEPPEESAQAEPAEAEPAEAEPVEAETTRAAAPVRRPRRARRADPPAAPAATPEPEAPPVGRAATTADPAAARALHAQGTTALVQGRLPDAIRLFRDATLAAPRHGPSWRGLGLAYERLGRNADARRAFERYLSVAGAAPDAAAIRERIAQL